MGIPDSWLPVIPHTDVLIGSYPSDQLMAGHNPVIIRDGTFSRDVINTFSKSRYMSSLSLDSMYMDV
jgi:hypothetical protein